MRWRLSLQVHLLLNHRGLEYSLEEDYLSARNGIKHCLPGYG